MMGYTLYCAEARMMPERDLSSELTVMIENLGVVPFYYLWPTELQALDASGRTVAQMRVLWPPSSLLPGKKTEWSAEWCARMQEDSR